MLFQWNLPYTWKLFLACTIVQFLVRGRVTARWMGWMIHSRLIRFDDGVFTVHRYPIIIE